MEYWDFSLIWVVITILFFSIEVLSPHLVTLWFAIGAITSIIAASLGLDLKIQIFLFFIISIILLILLRPIYLKYIKPQKAKTNLDLIIGECGVVVSKIDNNQSIGLVKVSGQVWSAKSVDNNNILEGSKVEILKIDGVKLVVRELAV